MNRSELDAFQRAINADRYNRSLRVVFADWLEERGIDDEAAYQRAWTEERQRHEDAEEWLRTYAARMNSYDTPEKAFESLVDGLKSAELYAHGTDLHGLYDVDDIEELKKQAEIYLKGPIPDWDRFSFGCSC